MPTCAIALSAPPRANASLPQRLCTRHALEILAKALHDNPAAWPTRQVCLVDGGAPTSRVVADLQQCHVLDQKEYIEVLVWIGTGCGWEESDTATLMQVVSRLTPPPRLVVVTLKYGAQACSAPLLAAGVSTVLWMHAPSLEEPLPLLLNVIAPSLKLALTPTDVTMVESELRERGRGLFGASWSADVGCTGAPITLLNAADGEWVRYAIDDVTLPSCAMALLPPRSNGLEELALLSMDLAAVEDVNDRLATHTRAGGYRVAIAPPDAADEDDAARSRAIAIEVCSQHLLARGGRYLLVCRCTTPVDVQEVADAVRALGAGDAASGDDRGGAALTLPEDHETVSVEAKAGVDEAELVDDEAVNDEEEEAAVLLWFDYCDTDALADAAQSIAALEAAGAEAGVVVHSLVTCATRNGGAPLAALMQSADDSHASLLVLDVQLDASRGVRADALHDELLLEVTLEPSGERLPLLDVVAPHALRGAIAAALPSGQRRPICAMYVDGADGCTLSVRLCLSDVGFVHTLRDAVLSGDFDTECTRQLAALPRDVRLLLQGELRVGPNTPQETADASEIAADSPRRSASGLVRGFFSRASSRPKRQRPPPPPLHRILLTTERLEWFESADEAMLTPSGSVRLSSGVACALEANGKQLHVTGNDGVSMVFTARVEGKKDAAGDVPLSDWHAALAARISELSNVDAAATAPAAIGNSTMAGGSGSAHAAVRAYASGRGTLAVHTDKTHFAERYEASVLALENLTPHQRDALACARLHEHVLLEAPAGGGKTFVALSLMLEVLLRDSHHGNTHADACVAFACWSAPLCLFVCRWICKRITSAAVRARALSRLVVLFDPLDAGPRAVRLVPSADGLRLECPPAALTGPIELLVVDESHHIYADTALRRAVEDLVQPGTTRRLLLADISQSSGGAIPFPLECARVSLTEVVRCSKRIIAGAMAFQLGGEQKLLTRCHHESTGPPLKSFLFDMDADLHESAAACYAHHVTQAITHVRTTYRGLALHDRVAILCPSSEFAHDLAAPLRAALAAAFPEWRVRLVSAADASASIGDALDGTSAPADGCESLVLDAIGQFDGLERLIVIGVGLDQPISELPDATTSYEPSGAASAPHAPSGDDQRTRSMLYRAVTRAHMQVLVVNELLSGGWLEFLGNVRLRDDERFDAARALDRCETSAVENIVTSGIDERLRDGAQRANLPLDALAISALRAEVARATEGGADVEVAVSETLRGWASEVGMVSKAIRRAAHDLGADLTAPTTAAAITATKKSGRGDPDSAEIDGVDAVVAVANRGATLLDELTLSVAVVLRRGEAVRLDLAAESAVRKHQEKQHHARVDAALLAHAATLPPTPFEIRDELFLLRQLVGTDMANGVAMATAVERALADCNAIQTEVRRLFDAEASSRGMTNLDVQTTAKLLNKIRDEMRRNEPMARAVQSVLRTQRTDEVSERCAAALDEYLGSSHRAPPATLDGEARAALLDTLSRRVEYEAARPAKRQLSALMQAWRALEEAATLAFEEQAAARELLFEEAGPWAKAALVNTLCVQRWRAVFRADANITFLHAWQDVPAANAQVEANGEVAADANGDPDAPMANNDAGAGNDGDGGAVAGGADAAGDGDGENDGENGEDDPEDAGPFNAGVDPDGHRVLGDDVPLPPSILSLAKDALDEMEREAYLRGERAARIGAALEAAAKAERLLLTDAASNVLKGRIAAALQRGEALDTATRAAVAAWHRQLVRRQVQQSTWDPSGNTSRKVSGVLKFMPFKHKEAEYLEYDLLALVFAHLPFEALPSLSLVSKRWRSVATDPSWKPEVVVLAWGRAGLTGLPGAAACPRPTILPFAMARQVLQVACTDEATLALTIEGSVWHWGKYWLRHLAAEVQHTEPTLLPELRDVASVAVSVPGYHHHRRIASGYTCAAVTRNGHLYTWGPNEMGQLLRVGTNAQNAHVSYSERPGRVSFAEYNARIDSTPITRVISVACGRNFTAIYTAGETDDPDAAEGGGRQVLTCGAFCFEAPHALRAWAALDGLALRQLSAGAFHCCCLTVAGELYTWGHPWGADHANGNLLGQGPPDAMLADLLPDEDNEPGPRHVNGLERHPDQFGPAHGARLPRRVVGQFPGEPPMGAVAEVSCSTYSTIAITVDGMAYTWGDCDGDSLGHGVPEEQYHVEHHEYHVPRRIVSLCGLRVAHGALCYTNGAAALSDGQVYVWGGGMWQGGIGGGSQGPQRVGVGGGVPPCYQCKSVALGTWHGYCVLHRLP